MIRAMNQHEYRDFESAVLEFEHKFCHQSQSVKALVESVRQRCRIFAHAADYDFKDIAGNGYRTQCRLFSKWFRLANRMSEKSTRFKDFVQVMENVSSSLLLLDNEYVTGRQKQLLLVDLSMRVTPFFLRGDFLVIDGNSQMRRLMKTFVAVASVLLASSLPETLKCMISVRNCSANYIKSLAKKSPGDVAHFVRKLNWLPVRMSSRILSMFAKSSSAARSVKHRLLLPSHFEFHVSAHTVTLQPRSSVGATAVRMRQVTSSQDQETGQVLVFVHGGGFVGPAADSIHNVFICDWAAHLPGVTILNVDVSLAPEQPFPVPLQELLDLFLWLISGCDLVTETIGFTPQEVVLCGDSSGGNMVAALAVALNDLRRVDAARVRQMPKALVLFVPKLSLDCDVTASSFLAVIDPMINPLFQLKAAQAYVPFVRHISGGGNGGDGSVELLVENSELPLNWLSDENYEPVKSCYLSPLSYDKMGELKDVKLYLMAYHFDPFLDES